MLQVYNIPYLIFGLIVTVIVPLGLLKAAILYSDSKHKQKNKLNH